MDATVHALERLRAESPQRWRVATAKFQSAVRPGEVLVLEHEALGNGSIRFAIRTADRAIATGVLTPLEQNAPIESGVE